GALAVGGRIVVFNSKPETRNLKLRDNKGGHLTRSHLAPFGPLHQNPVLIRKKANLSPYGGAPPTVHASGVSGLPCSLLGGPKRELRHSAANGEDIMPNPASASSTTDIQLRKVTADDLPVFFEHQRDPEAIRMAAFTAADPTDWAAFAAKWAR